MGEDVGFEPTTHGTQSINNELLLLSFINKFCSHKYYNIFFWKCQIFSYYQDEFLIRARMLPITSNPQKWIEDSNLTTSLGYYLIIIADFVFNHFSFSIYIITYFFIKIKFFLIHSTSFSTVFVLSLIRRDIWYSLESYWAYEYDFPKLKFSVLFLLPFVIISFLYLSYIYIITYFFIKIKFYFFGET